MKVLKQFESVDWAAYNVDCVEGLRGLPDNSIDYAVWSPPFRGLYVYSNSDRDFANNSDDGVFAEHYRFLCAELFRVMKPGRLFSVHCMVLPTSKTRDGVIGLSDFPGELIRVHQESGMIYHSKVIIWRDPVIAMQRTKALGLLHKQVVKDSCMSRQGIPDELLTFRKPGANAEPVAGKFDTFVGEDAPKMGVDEVRNSINIWQRYASPVWMDIDPSDTLQYRSARANEDERHICPLALSVIRRGMQMWSNEGDIVLDPFMGIASTGFVALEQGRKFIGFELKPSYYDASVKNLRKAEIDAKQDRAGLFDDLDKSSHESTQPTELDEEDILAEKMLAQQRADTTVMPMSDESDSEDL